MSRKSGAHCLKSKSKLHTQTHSIQLTLYADSRTWTSCSLSSHVTRHHAHALIEQLHEMLKSDTYRRRAIDCDSVVVVIETWPRNRVSD